MYKKFYKIKALYEQVAGIRISSDGMMSELWANVWKLLLNIQKDFYYIKYPWIFHVSIVAYMYNK